MHKTPYLYKSIAYNNAALLENLMSLSSKNGDFNTRVTQE